LKAFIGALMLNTMLQAGIQWRDLPPLPKALGGQFVGTIGERLVVAGGSHWDGVLKPWEGGKKVWVDTIYTLAPGDRQWTLAGRLPHRMGYGTALSRGDSMLLIGGQTADRCLANVYRLSLAAGKIKVDELEPMPSPASNTAGGVIDDVVYVAGGQESPSSTKALKQLRALQNGRWKVLEDWPGAPAIMPVAASAGGFLYLLGGAVLTGTPGPPPGRRFLRQALRYRPGKGWETLPDLPAPSQAGYALAQHNDVLLFGGNDGSLADREYEVRDTHPGFRREVWRFAAPERAWRRIATLPGSFVTSGITTWNGEFVIAGGEDRIAHRTARVIAGRLENK